MNFAFKALKEMDVKKILQQVVMLFFITWLMILLSMLANNSKVNFQNGMKPIDSEMKTNLDDCYLTIHNFVSVNQTWEKRNESSNKHIIKTYIYSYTKPYLLELVQNSTESCLCCN